MIINRLRDCACALAIALAAAPACARERPVPPPAPTTGLDALECLDGMIHAPDRDGTRVYEMDAATYDATLVRLVMDVRAGPTPDVAAGDTVRSTWTLADRTHRSWLASVGLSSVAVERSRSLVRVVLRTSAASSTDSTIATMLHR